jgi:hypothetical protein
MCRDRHSRQLQSLCVAHLDPPTCPLAVQSELQILGHHGCMFHSGVDIAEFITSIIVERLTFGRVIKKEAYHVKSSLEHFARASGTRPQANLGLRKYLKIDRFVAACFGSKATESPPCRGATPPEGQRPLRSYGRRSVSYGTIGNVLLPSLCSRPSSPCGEYRRGVQPEKNRQAVTACARCLFGRPILKRIPPRRDKRRGRAE